MVRTELPTLTMERFRPRRLDSRRQRSPRKVLEREVTATISPRVAPSQGLPLPVDPPFFFPAELLSMGANLAQEARWPAVGKRLMSMPISTGLQAHPPSAEARP